MVENCREMSKTKQNKESWGTSDVDVLFFYYFQKKFVREKWYFCNAYAIVDAVLIVTYRVMTFVI